MMRKDDTSARARQFEVERQLRRRILSSSRENRCLVVDQVYHELFARCPHHGRLTETAEVRIRQGRMKARLILPLLKPKTEILEVGCGTGSVLTALMEMGYKCAGIEASREMLDICTKQGLEVAFGTADHIEFPANSFDFVFSQEVLEHLQPEDVPRHFSEAFRVLRPNGILAVETPNRRTGPQDVSRGFTRVAQGLHLKEWGVSELVCLFRDSGFANIRGLLAPQFLARRSPIVHRISRVPARVKYVQDWVLVVVPMSRLKRLAGKILGLDDIFLFARKPCGD